jgi:hypothetical protein
MRRSRCLAVLLVLLAIPAGVRAAGGGRAHRSSCPDDLAAAIAERCPCDGAKNHGQYVACLVRLGNALGKAGCLGDAELAAFRCAARSTCGKPAAVVCCTAATGVCNDHLCGEDGGLPCDTDADCTTLRARYARDERTCAAAGGVSAGPGSVCDACTLPSTTSTTATTSTTTSSTSTTTSTTSTTATTSTSTTLAAGINYGNDVEFPSASAHAPDYLLGSLVMLPEPSMLTRLCVIAKSGGANVMLALYTDNAGWPDQLVAATPATPMTAGRMEIPVAPTSLAAGSYWIMGVYDVDASIGIDESDPQAPVRYIWQSFASPLPDPFGPSSPYSGQRFNYYVQVE